MMIDDIEDCDVQDSRLEQFPMFRIHNFNDSQLLQQFTILRIHNIQLLPVDSAPLVGDL